MSKDKVRQGTTTVDAAPGTGSTKVRTADVTLTVKEGATGDGTIVGKRVVLAARNGKNDPVPGRWLIDGAKYGREAIKGYDCDWSGVATATAAVHLLTEKDLAASDVELYWIKGGVKQLSFTTDTAHGAVTVPMELKVRSPIVAVSQGSTTRAGKFVNGQQTLVGFGDHYKGPGAWPGIRFGYVVIPPPGGDGEIAGVQLIVDKTVIAELPDIVHKPVWKGDWWLDSAAPYGPSNRVKENLPGAWAHESYDTGDGAGPHNEHSDTPTRILQTHWTEVRTEQGFRMYLMYRPDGSGKDSIWVTLACIDWSWSVSVKSPDGNNVWEGGEDASYTVNPTGRAWSELPTWNHVFDREQAATYWEPQLGTWIDPKE
jgi:hypothetical protein